MRASSNWADPAGVAGKALYSSIVSPEADKDRPASPSGAGDSDDWEGASPYLDQAELDAFIEAAAEADSEKVASYIPPPRIPEVSALDDVPAPIEPDIVKALDETEIDELLGGEDQDRPLVESDPDALIVPGETPVPGADMDTVLGESPAVEAALPESVGQSEIDALISSLDGSDVETEAAPSLAVAPMTSALSPDAESEPLLSQDMLDSLLAESESKGEIPEAIEPAMAVPVASAPMPPVELASSPTPVERKPPRPKRPRRHIVLPRNILKYITSVAAGVFVTLATFTYLYTHPQRLPGPETLSTATPVSLVDASHEAEQAMSAGQYAHAIEVMDRALQGNPRAANRAEAELLRIEARYRSMPEKLKGPEALPTHAEILRFLTDNPDHPRAPELLMWAADLYNRAEFPYEARRCYTWLRARYPQYAGIDEALFQAARLSLQTRHPGDALDLLAELLQGYPASPRGPEAELLVADAYIEEREPGKARPWLEDLIERHANTRLGSEAYARLGRIAFDEGNAAEAIRLLEARLQSATTTQGNEAVYYYLARAYRAAGRPADAERILHDLLEFFPENEYTANAHIELAQAFEDQSKLNQALTIAEQAIKRYPSNASVQQKYGHLLALTGDRRGAAQALASAYEIGLHDPALLLEAGRNFVEGKAFDDARQTFEQLAQSHPKAPEAFQARMELAQLDLQQNRTGRAIERLEEMARITKGSSAHLGVLMNLGRIYADAGLPRRAARVYAEALPLASEPEAQAAAVTAMLNAGFADEALSTAGQLDVAKLTSPTAYAFLMAYGKALFRVEPARAIETMERAYTSYPEHRVAEDTQTLLEAYLTRDETAKSRGLVADMETLARGRPGEYPKFKKLGITYADYLFRKQDYRGAREAYELVARAPGGSPADQQWAEFQWASSLLNMKDDEEALTRLEVIADSDSPWAQDARGKADYIQLTRRLDPYLARAAARVPMEDLMPPETQAPEAESAPAAGTEVTP